MTRPDPFSHCIALDDAPFPRSHRGDVPIVGIACSNLRVEGVLRSKVRRDGADSTRAIAEMVRSSRFFAHNRLVLMEGIAVAGFNVVDIHGLSKDLGMAVLVVSKKNPNLEAIEIALLERVRGGKRKWRLIQEAGPMEPMENLFVQRAGISVDETKNVLSRLAVFGRLPEPVRLAHLVASALALPGSIPKP